MKPVYYQYVNPEDCWNNWKVIIQTTEKEFYGVAKMWPNGEMLDYSLAGGLFEPSPLWVKITLEKAIELCS